MTKNKIDDGIIAPDMKTSVLAPPPASNVMSLRDYFAGQAIAGMLGNSTNIDSLNEQLRHSMEDGLFDRILATHAYEIADAMLSARSSGGASDAE